MGTFLGDLDARPLSLGRSAEDLKPLALHIAASGSWPTEVAVVEAAKRPTAARLREVWRDRSKGRASPLIVVALQGDLAHLCGPAGDEPPVHQDIPQSVAERICRVALQEPDSNSALRFLRAALPDADSRIPGLRNEGLLATHELKTGVPMRPDWRAALASAAAAARHRGQDLVRALGFNFKTLTGPVSLLCVGEKRTAVAVFLDRSEHPEASSTRFNGSSPVSYALARAEEENLKYVIVLHGSALRLHPVDASGAVGGRGRPETYVELHLELIAPEQIGYLWLLFSNEALRPGGTFEDLVERSARFATALGRRLRERIYEGVIGRLAAAIANARSLKRHSAADLDLTYQATLTLLFRLLFIAYAEDGDFLPYKDSGRYRSRSLKKIAHELRDLAREGKHFDEGAHYWAETRRLFRAVDEGQKEWGVPRYNGGLFSRDPEVSPAGAILDAIELGNDVYAPALTQLLLDDTGDGQLGPVDFRSLGVREFGTIYEGLLECELSVAEEDLTLDPKAGYRPLKKRSDAVSVEKGAVYLHDRSGGRKATGSYYTKDFAVEHLLDHALEPALKAHTRSLDGIHDPAEASKRFFDFRIADIAMGSGHFLIAAIDRIERRLSTYLTNRTLPGVTEEIRRLRAAAVDAVGGAGAAGEIEDTQLLRRQIARRCVFGVDLNPLAVDLARLSVWVHTFVPGLPLSFLDHNLVVGNSLVGIAVFDEMREIIGEGYFGIDPLVALLEKAKDDVRKLGELADADAAEVREARATDRRIHDTLEPLRIACTILAAARVEQSVLDEVRYGKFLGLAKSPASLAKSDLAKAALEALKGVRPFHFPTEFPEVFGGDRPGFDVIVGNPPWEEASIEEDDFWTRYIPGFQAKEQKEQEDLKRRWRKERPDLVKKLEAEQRDAEGLRAQLANGPFPGMGTGDADLYKAFCWRFWALVRKEGGMVGVVLPRSAFAAKGSTDFRKAILAEGTFSDLTFLLNSGGWVFDEAEPRYTIALCALSRAKPGEDGTLPMRGPYRSLQEFEEGVGRPALRFPLADVLAWTDTATLPLLPDGASAAIFAQLRKAPRLDLDDCESWLFRPYRELDATNDKPHFKFVEDMPKGHVPVFKGESFDIWKPDTGAYYAYADPKRVLGALFEKRARSARKKDSPWSHLDGASLTNDATMPFQSARVAFRDVTNRTNQRTVIAALLPPRVFISNQAPFLIRVRGDEKDEAFLVGILSSIPLDWFARRFVETHVNFFLLNMLPVPRPPRNDPLWKRVVKLAGRLAAADERFAYWAGAVGVDYGPLPEARRESMIAELDALAARLYGLTADQLAHLFATFHEGWDYEARLGRVMEYFE